MNSKPLDINNNIDFSHRTKLVDTTFSGGPFGQDPADYLHTIDSMSARALGMLQLLEAYFEDHDNPPFVYASIDAIINEVHDIKATAYAGSRRATLATDDNRDKRTGCPCI